MHFPRLVFGPEHDERSKIEMTSRGYASHVFAETASGRYYSVFFYDPFRLRQDLESGAEYGTPFLAEPGMIVVPEVTKEAMEIAIKGLHKEGYFDYLQPILSPQGMSE